MNLNETRAGRAGNPTIKIILLMLLFFIFVPFSNAHVILLKNGKKIIVKDFWERGDEIVYQKFGADVHVKKDDIEKIIYEKKKKTAPREVKPQDPTNVPRQQNVEEKDPFYSELYDQALELYHQQKYEKVIGLMSMYIDNGTHLSGPYLYRGSALFELARDLEQSEEKRIEMGVYAKSDLDKAISLGDQSGLAYITRAKIKWLLLSEDKPSVEEDLDKVIDDGLPLSGMAYYWKAKHAQALEMPFEANRLMQKSADFGYEDATRVLFENPLWPRTASPKRE